MKLSAGQYYGSIHKSFNYNGLILSKSYYSNEKPLPVHHHENPYFCYVLKGGYREQSNRIDEYCSKGDIIFHPSETEHTDTFIDILSVCFNIELTGMWKSLIDRNKTAEYAITKTCSHKLQALVLKIYSEMNDPDELSQIVTEGLMAELVVYFSENNIVYYSNPSYLKTVTEFIRETYSSNPTLAELSQLAGVTPEHLARGFKNKFKTTIGEYIRNMKLAAAVDMLNKTNKPLAEIAYEAGFSDQSHFTRTLKKVMGVTPKSYRNIS